MATDVIVATRVMRQKIDRIADSREQRDTTCGMGAGLGVGHYRDEVRSAAADMAAAWLAVADDYDVTLDDLNAVTDLAAGALDAVQSARRRLCR
jgi:hypothetical protein